jgi:hypothetical protein
MRTGSTLMGIRNLIGAFRRVGYGDAVAVVTSMYALHMRVMNDIYPFLC